MEDCRKIQRVESLPGGWEKLSAVVVPKKADIMTGGLQFRHGFALRGWQDSCKGGQFWSQFGFESLPGVVWERLRAEFTYVPYHDLGGLAKPRAFEVRNHG